jgi:hypothetical protein
VIKLLKNLVLNKEVQSVEFWRDQNADCKKYQIVCSIRIGGLSDDFLGFGGTIQAALKDAFRKTEWPANANEEKIITPI